MTSPPDGLDLRRAIASPITAVVVIAAAVVSRLPTLAHPVVEANFWRQTQTAFPARIYAEEGIDLLHPQVPVLGPPFTLTFELPLYQAVAALLIDLGLQPEVALRGLSLACFAGTAALLWLLLARHVNVRTALIGVLIFSFTPLAIVYSRSSLIEYPAVLCALLFMFAILEWHAGRGRRWLVVAVIGGTLAALIKVTTAVFWVAGGLLTRRWQVFLACAIAGAIGLAWSLYAEASRGGLPPEAGLGGAALREWIFGGDRLDPLSWILTLSLAQINVSLLLLPVAILVLARRERLVWAWLSLALLGPLALFTNLYVIQDYYWIAVSPAAAGLIAGGFDRLLDRGGKRRTLALGGMLAATVVTLVVMSDYWLQAYRGSDPGGVLERAAVLRAETDEDDLVALGCTTWNPAIMFYADRRGTAFPGDSTYVTVADPRVCLEGEKAVPTASAH